MKKTLLLFLFAISFIANSQTPVSRATLLTPPYSWINRLVPTNTSPNFYLSKTFASFWNIVDDGTPLTNSTGWSLSGNAVSTNTNFIGTTTNRTFRIRTNNIERGKIDSLGRTILFGDFLIDQSGGVNTLSPKKITVTPYTVAPSFLAIYLNQNIPDGVNYFTIGDTNNTFINARKILGLNSGHVRFLTGQSTFTNAGTVVTLDAVTNTVAVVNAEQRHFTIAGNLTTYTAGTIPLVRNVLISANTSSALTTANITNHIGMELNVPIAGTGITVTNNSWSAYLKGDVNITTNLSIGSLLLLPTARLHLAAGNATLAAMQLTSQTLLTSTLTGAIERNGQDLFYTNTAGRMKVGLVLTGSATLNFASTVAFTSSELTITVTGAVDGDDVIVSPLNSAYNANSNYTARVSAANTVSVAFNNFSAVAIDPASAVFKVTVIRN